MYRLFIIVSALFLYQISYSQSSYPDVVFETTAGKFTVRLYEDTPLHSENFLKLVKAGYYNGLLFHRVIKKFMIQTGDPNSRNAKPGVQLGYGGPSYTIPPEFVAKYYHKKGALAMARQGDNINPKKESNGSQFYIVEGIVFTNSQLDQMVQKGQHLPFSAQQRNDYTSIGGYPFLDYEYTVFGEVVQGLDVIDKIDNVATDPNDRPLQDVKIIKAYILKK